MLRRFARSLRSRRILAPQWANRRGVAFRSRLGARKAECEVEQMTLAIVNERGGEAPMTPSPEQRRQLVELMAAAVLAVHRASDHDTSRGEGADAAGE